MNNDPQRTLFRAILWTGLTLAAAIRLQANPPPNDHFADRIQLTGDRFQIAVAGSFNETTAEPGEPEHFGRHFAETKTAWWTWQSPRDGVAWLDVGDSLKRFAIYTGTELSNLDLVVLNRDYFVGAAFQVKAGTDYHIAVLGWDVWVELNMTLFDEPADRFDEAQELSGDEMVHAGDNSAATADPGEPDHAENADGKSLWWKWIPANTQRYRAVLSRTENSANQVLRVYQGNDIASLQPVVIEDGTFAATGGATYHVALDSVRGNAGGSRWQINPALPKEAGPIRFRLVPWSICDDSDYSYSGFIVTDGVTVPNGGLSHITEWEITVNTPGHNDGVTQQVMTRANSTVTFKRGNASGMLAVGATRVRIGWTQTNPSVLTFTSDDVSLEFSTGHQRDPGSTIRIRDASEDPDFSKARFFEGGSKRVVATVDTSPRCEVPQPPTVSLMDGMIEVVWSGRDVILESSSDLNAWTPLSDAVSPLGIPLGRRLEYYRLTYGAP